MSESELLKLSASYDSLVLPAQDALRAEFARRGMEAPLVEDEDRAEVASQRLVTLRRFRDLSEAIVARAVLESAGMFCFLRDENVVRLDWAYSNAVGGISLEVRPEDVDEAQNLLNQPIPPAIQYEQESEFLQPHCPTCGSIEITFEGSDRSAALVSTTFLGLPLPFGSESWRCSACGCRWADDEEVVADSGQK